MVLKNIKSKKGFTIVELLVVIVVIGILAAITVVSYTGVTTKADKAANLSNANSVLKAAESVYADVNSTYPATSTTVATVISNLNAGVAKVPANLDVSSASASSGNLDHISYRVKADGTGVCVGYWDPTPTAQARYIYGGTAISDNGTTCS